MIEKHRERLRMLCDQDVADLAYLLGVGDDEPFLIDAIERRGLVQADVVMKLLRSDKPEARRLVAELTRLHVHVSERPWPRPLPLARSRVPSYVCAMRRNLRLPRPDQEALRVRIGMTLRELIEAGVPVGLIVAERTAGHLRFSREPRDH